MQPRDKAARFLLARAEVGECASALDMAAVLGGPREALSTIADRVAAMCTGLIRR